MSKRLQLQLRQWQWRLLRFTLLAGMLFFPVLAMVHSAAQAGLAAASVTLKPAADAYVDSSYPSANYGTRTTLRVDGSPVIRSYLRFDLRGVSGTVTQARLRVYANTASTSGISVWGVSSTSWSETGITYANAPAPGSTAATSGAVGAGTWVDLDATRLVSAGRLVSLGLSTSGGTAISLASREAGTNAPQLVVSATSTGAATATITRTPTRTPTPAVLLAAGDIAKCGLTPTPPGPTSGAMITSDMLLNASGTLFTLGDNSNDTGTAENYQNCYDPTWGRLKSRTRPVMGNHDQIADPQGGPFFAYFSGKTGTYGHYSLNLGSWHIIVLNSNCGVGGQGCGAGSPQEQWLRSDLAATTKKCILAIWHTPLFTSGTQSANLGMKTFWQDLYAARADIILNGHNHNYERFALQNPDATPAADGIREFIVGTGGASLDVSSLPMAANQEVRSAAAYGYLKLTLRTSGYDWKFIPQAGKTFTDSGSGLCH